jgi:hypothetical protein
VRELWPASAFLSRKLVGNALKLLRSQANHKSPEWSLGTKSAQTARAISWVK